jgi:hypothetical protein
MKEDGFVVSKAIESDPYHVLRANQASLRMSDYPAALQIIRLQHWSMRLKF